ncbi:hypothetical protein D9611_006671 [Ephemerocybe angulata]|uniref:Uncharacterized protein n=1 Tax=Ephemerocybe angulata TaxID=980116 RepID=A0A8H5C801_9AGAR|nr:hypothetical protein D9611_006671 [Tulosesus angulatus]
MKTTISTLTTILVLALSTLVLASPIPYGSREIEARLDTELLTRSGRVIAQAQKIGRKIVETVAENPDSLIYDPLKKAHDTLKLGPPSTGKNSVTQNALQEEKEKKAAQEAAEKAEADANSDKVKQTLKEINKQTQDDIQKMQDNKPQTVTKAVKGLNPNQNAAPQPNPSAEPSSTGSKPAANKAAPEKAFAPKAAALKRAAPPKAARKRRATK